MLKARGPQFISRGIRVSRHAPWISHLLFVDDCLIFTQASKRGAYRISDILDIYNRGSGQLVNKNKSTIFFSNNCEQPAKQEMHDALQIPNEALGEKYLGLRPWLEKSLMVLLIMWLTGLGTLSMVGGGQLLSCAGREVLIKANAQVVPTYLMSFFKLLAPTCKVIKIYIYIYI